MSACVSASQVAVYCARSIMTGVVRWAMSRDMLAPLTVRHQTSVFGPGPQQLGRLTLTFGGRRLPSPRLPGLGHGPAADVPHGRVHRAEPAGPVRVREFDQGGQVAAGGGD